MGEDRVRFAVIGLGAGRHHAERLRSAPHAELVSLCDADEDRLGRVADQFGECERTTIYEVLLSRPDIDAVVVALPNFLHAPVTIAALRAGKHVLCEKPMARTAAEAAEMLQASRETGRKLMIHFNYRFTPAAVALHRFASEGGLGEVYHARSWWHRTRGIPGLGGWFTSKELAGGGPLVDLGVHRLDLALWLMGYPKPESVCGATYSALGREIAARQGKSFDVEDMASAFVRFENGATLVLEASWAANGELREEMLTQIYGTRAGILHRNVDAGYQFEARIFREREGEYVAVAPKLPAEVETPQEHFARCILEDRQPSATGEQGLEVMRILDAIYQSAERGEEVRL
ncbi:MAG: Gfo/Idh/MocA family oxidoreductase [Anaerolineae bacterium]|nr:Gfo/Idh/MocA family oxidoreductase [Anaerolineae bacterium]